MTVRVVGGSGGGSGALLAGPAAGVDPVPAGPCAQLETGLEQPILVAQYVFDVAGVVELERLASEPQCGWQLQALDLSTCELSPVDPVP